LNKIKQNKKDGNPLKTLRKSAFSRDFRLAGAEGLEPTMDVGKSRGLGWLDLF
jgi:hypothetical protein